MPRVKPHYAVKANPDPRILKVMREEDVGFEIASMPSWTSCSSWRSRTDVFYSNPVKITRPDRLCGLEGRPVYVIDSVES